MRFRAPNTAPTYGDHATRQCPICGKYIRVVEASGFLRQHGPRGDRCPGVTPAPVTHPTLQPTHEPEKPMTNPTPASILETVAPEPGSPEWLKTVSASKVAAILGVSKWASPYSMWRAMRGEIPSDDGKNMDDKSRGHYLEAGVLNWWMDHHDGLESIRTQVYVTHPDHPWATCTMDALAQDAHGNTIVVEVKTDDSHDDWGTPGTDEIPAYYAAQVMWSLACVPDAQFACVAVLFGHPHLGFEEFVIQRDPDLIAAIVAKCKDFYESLSGDEPPELDSSVATYEAVRAIHPDITKSDEAELTPDQAREFLESGDAAKAAVIRERAAKTVVLDVMGDAQYGVCDGLRVARRQPSKNGVALYTATKIRTIEGASS